MPATLVVHDLPCTEYSLADLTRAHELTQHPHVARVHVFAGVQFDPIARDLAVEYRIDQVPGTMPVLGTSVYRTSLTVQASDARVKRVLQQVCPDSCELYHRRRVVSYDSEPRFADGNVYIIVHGAMSASEREAIADEYAGACGIKYWCVENYESNSSGVRHTFHGVARAGAALIGDGECYYVPDKSGETIDPDTIVSLTCTPNDVKITYHREYDSIFIRGIEMEMIYEPADLDGTPDWFYDHIELDSDDGTGELDF